MKGFRIFVSASFIYNVTITSSFIVLFINTCLQFIIGKLKEDGWHVELDEFTDNTPFGTRQFTNVIATLNPEAERMLAVAAHYDSKLMTPENGKYFLAASDSAVPCAMMLDFAKLLADKKKSMQKVTPCLNIP